MHSSCLVGKILGILAAATVTASQATPQPSDSLAPFAAATIANLGPVLRPVNLLANILLPQAVVSTGAVAPHSTSESLPARIAPFLGALGASALRQTAAFQAMTWSRMLNTQVGAASPGVQNNNAFLQKAWRAVNSVKPDIGSSQIHGRPSALKFTLAVDAQVTLAPFHI